MKDLRMVSRRDGCPTFLFNYQGQRLTGFAISDEWIPWVHLDEVARLLSIRVAPSFFDVVRNCDNMDAARLGDGRVVINAFTLTGLTRNAGGRAARKIDMWLYTRLMPAMMRLCAGKAPPDRLIEPPQEYPVQRPDGRVEDCWNEAAVYQAALSGRAARGRDFLNKMASGGGFAKIDDWAQEVSATRH